MGAKTRQSKNRKKVHFSVSLRLKEEENKKSVFPVSAATAAAAETAKKGARLLKSAFRSFFFEVSEERY